MKKPLYQELASLLTAMSNCEKGNNAEWGAKHRDRIEELVSEHMPSGSGFDNGTKLDFDRSTENRLIFTTAFLHMNEGGFYDGWTDHVVRVRSSLGFGFELTVSGRNRNDIKDYIGDCFHSALSAEVE